MEGLLRFCHMHDLYPGKTLVVTDRSNDEFIKIDCNGTEIRMPLSIAGYLCFKLLTE